MQSNKLSRRQILVLAIFAFTVLITGTRASAQTETVLHSFTNGATDGGYPRAGVIFDKAGNLYGTTSAGGSADAGTVYELKPNGSGGWALSVLYSFVPKPKYTTDQISGLVFDKAGNLYGTTAIGGTFNDGRLFELVPQAGGGWSEKVLHNFHKNGTDGDLPLGGVVVNPAGDLYGTTVYGGTGTCEFNGCGTVYELALKDGRWVEEILYSFANNGADGTNPYFGLVFDTAGNLYGTTQYGGANNQGTVFELTRTEGGGWTETVLHSFGGSGDTGYPEGLIFNGGNLYGAAANGGSGAGNVFELTPIAGGGWSEEILYSFPYGSAGQNPEFPSGLVLNAAGNIYGESQGGTGLSGTVFELTPQPGGTWAEITLYNFDYYLGGATDGADPIGSLVLDAQGNLYGATQYGGSDDAGTVFEVTP